MFMNSEKYEKLADKITEIFKSGALLTGDVLQYIDSAFSFPSAKKLEKIITDDTGGEGDTLVELIFFPDEQIQVTLERLAEDTVFTKKDEEKLCNLLLGKKPETVIRLPDGRGSFAISMPRYSAEDFISRLNYTSSQDKTLIKKINTCIVDDDVRLSVKVKLRNARFDPEKEHLDFLNLFFEKMPCKDNSFIMCLDYVLSFLREHKSGQNILKELMEIKETLSDALYRTEQYEKELEKNNIETMLLRGTRNPGINKDEYQSQVEIIGRIVREIFRKDYK